jgi:hypothetical protein
MVALVNNDENIVDQHSCIIFAFLYSICSVLIITWFPTYLLGWAQRSIPTFFFYGACELYLQMLSHPIKTIRSYAIRPKSAMAACAAKCHQSFH